MENFVHRREGYFKRLFTVGVPIAALTISACSVDADVQAVRSDQIQTAADCVELGFESEGAMSAGSTQEAQGLIDDDPVLDMAPQQFLDYYRSTERNNRLKTTMDCFVAVIRDKARVDSSIVQTREAQDANGAPSSIYATFDRSPDQREFGSAVSIIGTPSTRETGTIVPATGEYIDPFGLAGALYHETAEDSFLASWMFTDIYDNQHDAVPYIVGVSERRGNSRTYDEFSVTSSGVLEIIRVVTDDGEDVTQNITNDTFTRPVEGTKRADAIIMTIIAGIIDGM